MKHKSYIFHIVGFMALGIAIYLSGDFILNTMSSKNEIPKSFYFWNLGDLFMKILFPTVILIGILQAIAGLTKGFELKKFGKIINLILIYSYTLLLVDVFIGLVFLFGIISPNLLNILRSLLGETLNSLNKVISYPSQPNLLTFGIFLFLSSLPIIGIYIVHVFLVFVIYITYHVVQVFSRQFRKKIATFTFINIQFLKLTSIFTLFIIFISFILVGYLCLIAASSIFKYESFSAFTSIPLVACTLVFGYLGLNLVIFSIILLSIIFTTLLIAFRSSLGKISYSKFFENIVFSYVWEFNSNILNIFEKYILPYSLLNFISGIIYIGLVKLNLLYAIESESVAKSKNARLIAKDYCLKLLNSNNLLVRPNIKYIFISNIATKLLRFGDLKFANQLYSALWVYIKSSKSKSFLRRNSLDDLFTHLIQYNLETYQFAQLDLFLNDSLEELSKKRISKIVFYSNKVRINFAKQLYYLSSNEDLIQLDINEFSLEDKLDLFLSLSDFSRLNPWNLKSPLDLYKLVLYSKVSIRSSTNKIDKYKEIELTKLAQEIDRIFNIQYQLYSLVAQKSNIWIFSKGDTDILITQNLVFECFNIKIKFINPFFIDNQKLIPLALLSVNNYFLYEILDPLYSIANLQDNQLQLAFIKCCHGKYLLQNGSLNEGLEILLNGINLYEGIRFSAVTDQLGTTFGSVYLEYYDWVIDALIQQSRELELENKFKEAQIKIKNASNYVELSTARALLDLVSNRTYYSNKSESSSPIFQLISEIKEIDFYVHSIKYISYEEPFFAHLLPSRFLTELRENFYIYKSKKISKIENQRKILLEQLSFINPIAATLFEIKPLRWNLDLEFFDQYIPFEYLWSSISNQDVAVHRKEAILSFHILHKPHFNTKIKTWDKILCFILYKQDDSIKFHYHLIDESKIVLELQKYCNEIVQLVKVSQITKSKTKRENQKQLNKCIDCISENLISPLLSFIPEEYNKLTISSNSDLQFFPWSLLLDQELDDILTRYRIRTTPGLTLLYLLKQRENFRGNRIPNHFLVAGIEKYRDVLFWNSVGVERISEFHKSVSVLRDTDVDNHFVEQFKHADIIQYFGHGEYDQSNSYLEASDKVYLRFCNRELSATQILDGELYNPNAKVMILSACLTGLGDLSLSGSEILGLERAFFHSGLSSLITTLWSVDNLATVLLMIKLHIIWKDYNNTLTSLSYSLKEAQLWLKNLTFIQLKQEFPNFEDDFSSCIQTYQSILSQNEDSLNSKTKKQFESEINNANQFISAMNEGSIKCPYSHPYFWAAFQVKGLG